MIFISKIFFRFSSLSLQRIEDFLRFFAKKKNAKNSQFYIFLFPQVSVEDENAPFKYDLQRQHVVFCGTEILQGKAQTGDYCKSVVIRTGNFRQIVNNYT